MVELGLHKDLKTGWLKTDSDLAIFDLVSVYPRTWQGLCAGIRNDRLLVRLNNDSVLTNITRSTNSQELAVPLPSLSAFPLQIMIYC